MDDKEQLLYNVLTHQRIELLRRLVDEMAHVNDTTIDYPPHHLATIALVQDLIGQIANNAKERLEAFIANESEGHE